MKSIKKALLILVAFFSVTSVFAQSVEQGKKYIYYEKFKSAKAELEKVLAANPSNEDAAYLLGQAEIGLENIPAAKATYQKYLSVNPNSALLIAGMGHVELLEGKKADARNRFETAISLTKGKNVAVLNAVGYANANPDSKNGDAAYAIEKLRQATQIKGMKDPEIWTNLGDAYRKFADGSNAVQAYNSALALNPNYARAIYRIGKVYQTQGYAQEDLFMKYYNDAITKDPAYAPVYANLFSYYYDNNVTRSAEYLDKWLANSDDDPKACSYRASMKYAQGLFNDAIKKADQCIAEGGETPYPNLFGIKALAYNRIGDSLNAKASYDEYFKRQNPDNIKAGDYASYATILLKFPGKEGEAAALVEKAVAMDSLEANRIAYIKGMAKAYEDQKDYMEAGKWYSKVMDVKKNFTNVDLFNAGYNYYLANALDSSNVYFTKYTEKYPEDIMGYYMLGNANAILDSTNEKGLAVPYYNKVIEIGEKDTAKPNAKTRLLNAYRFFIGYYYNTKKDRDSALAYVDKALALEPTDEQLLANRDFISKNDPNAPAKKSGSQKK